MAPRRSPSPHPSARPGVSFADATSLSASGLEAMAAEILEAAVGKPTGATRPGILRGSDFIKGKRQKGANKNSTKGKGSKGKKNGKGKGAGKNGKGKPNIPPPSKSPERPSIPKRDKSPKPPELRPAKKKKKKAPEGKDGEAPSPSGSL